MAYTKAQRKSQRHRQMTKGYFNSGRMKSSYDMNRSYQKQSLLSRLIQIFGKEKV